MLKDEQVVLFQGDSITDAGRNRELPEANHAAALGLGYAHHAAAALLSRFPKKRLRTYNRGIGGNIVQQLEERWDEDCLKLNPDLLSILIGINDTARSHQPEQKGHTPQEFDRCLRGIISRAVQQNPTLQLVICEPFMAVVREAQNPWQEGFEQRRAITQQIATDLGAVFVPFQTLFDEMFEEAPVAYWLPDGVHPTPPAHLRMSKLWLDCVLGD